MSSRIERTAVAGGLDELAAALASIEPGWLAIIAGDEIFASNASSETVELAETLGAPVFGASWPAHIPFPTAHPLWSGSLHTTASGIRAQLAPFDAVLVLGGHSAIAYPYTEGPAIPPRCRLFQLSADVHNLGRIYTPAFSAVGDIRASLRALLPKLRDSAGLRRNEIAAVIEQAARTHSASHEKLASRIREELSPTAITPLVAASEVLRATGPEVAIVDEAPATMGAVRALLCSSSSRQYFFMRSAILGWGMPAAVGVSLGLDREPVVALLGDGAALYSPQALWTAAHQRLPVTFVVMNNREYNILKNYMRDREQYQNTQARGFIGMDLVNPAIDFRALAASMGVPAVRIRHVGELADAVKDGVASGRPNLVEVPISA